MSSLPQRKPNGAIFGEGARVPKPRKAEKSRVKGPGS